MPPAFPLVIVSPERLAVWPASTATIAEANEAPVARSMVRLLAPGPWMAMLLFRSGSGVCRSIVPATEKPIVNLSEWLPRSAVWMAARRLPKPASASELTVRGTCAGTAPSSNASSRGRKRVAGRVARGVELCFAVRFRSQEKNDMVFLLSRTDLRLNEDTIVSGAQTERRGVVGPVRDCLGCEPAPAASFSNGDR